MLGEEFVKIFSRDTGVNAVVHLHRHALAVANADAKAACQCYIILEMMLGNGFLQQFHDFG